MLEKGSWRMARVFGVDVYLHWSFALLMVWVLGQGVRAYRYWDRVALIIFLLLILFGCVALHELGHALAARRLNVAVRNIVIFPFGGVAQIEFRPNRPAADLLIALAGPLVNLALAAVALLALVLAGQFHLLPGLLRPSATITEAILQASRQQEVLAALLLFVLVINGMLFLFNLIPAFPLDGGRILRAGLVMILPPPHGALTARWVGLVMAVALLALALVLKSVGLLLVGGLVFAAGWLMRPEENKPGLTADD